jgi:hypothetical protein
MGRYLLALVAAAIVVGLAWPWLERLGLGRLPGDIRVRRGNSFFRIPIATTVVLSLALSALVWLFRR